MNYETIREYVEAGLTPTQIVTELQAVTVEVPNTTAWTFGAIEATIDAATARLIAGVVQAAGQSDPLMSSAFVALSTTGLQLHTAARQALIEQIGQAAGMTADQIAVVKELGLTITHPFADVTETDIIKCKCEERLNRVASAVVDARATLSNLTSSGDALQADIDAILATLAGVV